MFDKESIKEIAKSESISAAMKSVVSQVDGVVPLPDDFKLHDLEQYFTYRRRARGTMQTFSLHDFAVYTKSHIEAYVPNIFVNQSEMSATAILNMGTPEYPGHTDNRATLFLKKTAAYQALLAVNGTGIEQNKAAEFLEDWADNVECVNGDGTIVLKHAVAAIRKLAIESTAKMESTVSQLSASKSAFEAIACSSKEPIPQLIHFSCQPYHGLPHRKFSLRLGILTGAAKPVIVLRMIQQEQHDEDMAKEFVDLVRAAFSEEQTKALVMSGAYKANP